MRANIPREIETEVLLLSGRRCSLCFGLHSDFEPKKGQIAHIDHDSANGAIGNLAFLCLAHHDDYDSSTSQSKGFTISELKIYRDRLHAKVRERVSPEQKLRELLEQNTLEEEVVRDATDRLWALDSSQIGEQCRERLRRLVAATNAFQKVVSEIPTELPDEELDSLLGYEKKKCLISFGLPEDLYGLDGDVCCDDEWLPTVEPFLDEWGRGYLTHKECSELLWE